VTDLDAGCAVDRCVDRDVGEVSERVLQRLHFPEQQLALQAAGAGILVERQCGRTGLQHQALRRAFENGHGRSPRHEIPEPHYTA